MGKYSIRELEKLSGIKAHTIRIWEKRYQIVEPMRTDTNIRLYSDDDLKRIINVSLLNSHGFKISQIASMTSGELNEKVNTLSETQDLADIHIDSLITVMLDLDEESFNQKIESLEQRLGFEKTVTTIIYPYLQKIGLLWQTGNITPAHEHFISNLIRQRMIVSVASLPVPSKNTLRAILFLPEHEMHELALLFFNYICRRLGIRTYYLGQSVPHEDLKTVYQIHKPHFLITNLTATPPTLSLNEYLKLLATDFLQSLILTSGSLVRRSSYQHHSNIRIFETVTDLSGLLKD